MLIFFSNNYDNKKNQNLVPILEKMMFVWGAICENQTWSNINIVKKKVFA